MAYLNIGNSRYEIINHKPSTDYCISVHGNGLNGYCVLTKYKPGHNRDTFAVQTIDGIRYVNNPIKQMKKIKMYHNYWDTKNSNWWSWAKFYNKSNQLICTVPLKAWWTYAEGEIDTTLSDQSINRCHLYYYQDLHSGGGCYVTADVVDVDDETHRLFYGWFKNHGKGDNQYIGVGQPHNSRLSQNNFPMELRY